MIPISGDLALKLFKPLTCIHFEAVGHRTAHLTSFICIRIPLNIDLLNLAYDGSLYVRLVRLEKAPLH